MPKTPQPSEKEPKKGWSLHAVDDPEAELPPWERKNPFYGAGKHGERGQGGDKTTISVRVIPSRHKRMQKIIQQRTIPQIETVTDYVLLGLDMAEYWCALRSGDKDLKEMLDVAAWESDALSRKIYRERIITLLDGIEAELSGARRMSYKNRIKELCDELNRYRKKISDDELKARADKMYVEYVGVSK